MVEFVTYNIAFLCDINTLHNDVHLYTTTYFSMNLGKCVKRNELIKFICYCLEDNMQFGRVFYHSAFNYNERIQLNVLNCIFEQQLT